MTKLLLCPFCDEEPSFTDVELKDERRYAEKLLRCCSIEMSATLSFGQYKGLTDAQIDHQLRSELVKNWNTRAQPQAAPVPDLLATTISACGPNITIQCNSATDRDAIYDWIMSAASQLTRPLLLRDEGDKA